MQEERNQAKLLKNSVKTDGLVAEESSDGSDDGEQSPNFYNGNDVED